MGKLSGLPGPDPQSLVDEYDVPEHEENPAVAIKVDNVVKLLCNDDEAHIKWAELTPQLEELGFHITVRDVHPDYDPDNPINRMHRRWSTKRVTADDVKDLMSGHPGMTAEWYAERLYKTKPEWTEKEAEQAVAKFRVCIHRMAKRGEIERRYEGRTAVYLLPESTTILPKKPYGTPEHLPPKTWDEKRLAEAIRLYQKNLAYEEKGRVISKDDNAALMSMLRYILNAYHRC